MRAYLAALTKRGLAPNSSARKLSAIRQLHRFLYAEGKRGDDPAAVLEGPKRGRPLLRQSAYMLAIRSIIKGGIFRAEYEALCERNGGKKLKAVVAVMRSALRLLYSVARDRRMFTAEPPPRNRQRPVVDAA